MSFLDHLEDLRWAIMRSLIAVLAVSVVAFFFPKLILDEILFGPANKDFITYRLLCQLGEFLQMGDTLCIGELPFKEFISTELGAQFTWHLWTSFVTGIIVAFPYVAWELWRFVRPALHDNERRNIRGIVFFISLLFLLGIFFGYFLLAPLTVTFFGNYDISDRVANLPVFTSYVSSVLTVVFGCGVVFQLPIVIYFLARIGLVSPEFLKKYRRHAVVVILILAAIITPPDVASQMLVSLPLFLLYEISIVIARRVYK